MGTGVHAEGEEGDGAAAGDEARFHELPAPTPEDLALILHRIGFRQTGWLTRKGWIDPEGQRLAVAAGPGAEAGLPPELVAAAVAGCSALGARAANRWVTRLGVTRALETCGHLTIEEGRVSPPVSSASCDRIIEG